jgi:FeS assembly SUF system protein
MSEQDPNHPPHQTLPVLPNSGKVEKLRKEAEAHAAASRPSEPAAPQSAPPAPEKHVDTTLITRYLDAKKNPKQKAIEEKVIDALRTVYDPEIPLNIYDLGLIYGIDIHPETGKVDIRMTLTAPGCPVAGSIIMDVQSRVENIPEVPSADVELVWDPPWSQDRMSEEARLELGLM